MCIRDSTKFGLDVTVADLRRLESMIQQARAKRIAFR